jgi:FMN phosphatase YigB (HAD superfamily)
MPLDCVVFDFDGTLTAPGEVLPALQEATRNQLAIRLALSEEEIARRWAEAVTVVGSTPMSEGWEYEGHVVAPIRADPYLWTNALTRHVVRTAATSTLSAEALDREVVAVHRAAHEATPAPFRPDAKRVIDSLLSEGKQVFVVSNSDGNTIGRRLDELTLRARDRVYVWGRAGKFVICEPACSSGAFDAIPTSMQVEGLDRPVFLRRGRYFEKLEALWAHCGASAPDTLVCGDIFEIDLAMPAALGCATHLLVRDDTLGYERMAATSLPRGGESESLEALLDRVLRG